MQMQHSRNQRGSIFVLTIWATIVLSLFATNLSGRSSQALSVTQRLVEELQSSIEVSSIVHFAGERLSEDATEGYDGPLDSWREEGVFELSSVRGEPLFVYWKLTDEESKVPLNTAPANVLKAFFEYTGETRSLDAQSIADAIVDWRDEDSDMSPQGAESYSYDDYACKNAPFENIEELLLIKGMGVNVYARVAPYVTANSNGRMNLNTIGASAIRALGLSESGYNGFMTFRTGPDNILGTLDDRVFISSTSIAADLEKYIPLEDLNYLAKLEKKELFAVKSETFTLSGKVMSQESSAVVMEFSCVLDREGNILVWNEG